MFLRPLIRTKTIEMDNINPVLVPVLVPVLRPIKRALWRRIGSVLTRGTDRRKITIRLGVEEIPVVYP